MRELVITKERNHRRQDASKASKKVLRIFSEITQFSIFFQSFIIIINQKDDHTPRMHRKTHSKYIIVFIEHSFTAQQKLGKKYNLEETCTTGDMNSTGSGSNKE